MIIHVALSEGRKWNGRAFWNTDSLNECALTCPCMKPLVNGNREQGESCRTSRRYDAIRDRKMWTSVIIQEKTNGTNMNTYQKKKLHVWPKFQ